MSNDATYYTNQSDERRAIAAPTYTTDWRQLLRRYMMLRRLHPEEKEQIIRLKKKGRYKISTSQEKKGYRTHVAKLAQAWMAYIDILDLQYYNSKHFTAKNNEEYCDKLFSYGEIGAITRYLLKNDLIERDRWGRYKVKWRMKDETRSDARRKEKDLSH